MCISIGKCIQKITEAVQDTSNSFFSVHCLLTPTFALWNVVVVIPFVSFHSVVTGAFYCATNIIVLVMYYFSLEFSLPF